MFKSKKGQGCFFRTMFRGHSLLTAFSFLIYFTLTSLYDPAFLFSDTRERFQALADEVLVLVHIPGAPEKPEVTASAVCTNGELRVDLDWEDDEGSETYDMDRGGSILITDLTHSSYTDTAVSTGMLYEYQVTARGPMSPFEATSDTVSVTTPTTCMEAPSDAEISLTSFDGKSIDSYQGIPSTSENRPRFTGKTTIAYAVIDIAISGDSTIYGQTIANENGYFSYQLNRSLDTGRYTLTATATSPGNSLLSASSTFIFSIFDKEESEEEKGTSSSSASSTPEPKATQTTFPSKEPIPVLPKTPTEIPSISPMSAPLDLSLNVLRNSLRQGDSLDVTLTLNQLEAELVGTKARVLYTISDESGNQKGARVRDIILEQKLFLQESFLMDTTFVEGRYLLHAEILGTGFSVHRELAFSVTLRPLLEFSSWSITYPEFLHALGSISLWFLLLLLIWFCLFFREYSQSLRVIQVTEQTLRRKGFFGNGKGVDR